MGWPFPARAAESFRGNRAGPSKRESVPRFRYTVTDADGKKKRGTIEAESKVEAIGRLSELGHLVTEVEPEGAPSLSGRSMVLLLLA